MGILEILGLISAIATALGPLLQLHPKTARVGQGVTALGVDVGKVKRALIPTRTGMR